MRLPLYPKGGDGVAVPPPVGGGRLVEPPPAFLEQHGSPVDEPVHVVGDLGGEGLPGDAGPLAPVEELGVAPVLEVLARLGVRAEPHAKLAGERHPLPGRQGPPPRRAPEVLALNGVSTSDHILPT